MLRMWGNKYNIIIFHEQWNIFVNKKSMLFLNMLIHKLFYLNLFSWKNIVEMY
jgi:hypothetical protein